MLKNHTLLRDLIKNNQDEELSERYIETPQYVFEKPRPVFEDLKEKDIYHQHIPKQKDLEKMLQTLSKRIITDSYLPATKARIAKEQAADSFLGPIYRFIKHNLLPERKKAQSKLKLISEDYIMADDILFKINFNTKNSDLEKYHTRICIPETMESEVFYSEHDGLLANHPGQTKSYETMRRRYFIRGLYEKILSYVRGCHICQSRDSPKTIEKPYELRIPVNYTPFGKLYADFKELPKSASGNGFLLVVVCEITRYVECIPLRQCDAVTVAEALLRKVVFRYGPPETMIFDADKAFHNQISDYMWNALNTNTKTISPWNHQSNITERHIQSISRMLNANMRDCGKNWDLYAECCAYAHNSHIIPRLGYSPFYLVFLRNPPVMTHLNFTPITDIKSTHRAYVEFLKNRLEFVGKCILDKQEKIQHQQAATHLEKVKKPLRIKEGNLVYLISPTVSNLQTGMRKFKADWIGPLVVSEVIGHDLATLSDLEGRPLHGVFHFNRLKQGYIRLEKGVASTLNELRKEYNKQEMRLLPRATEDEIKAAQSGSTEYQFIYAMHDFTDNNRNMPGGAVILVEKPIKPSDVTEQITFYDNAP